MSQLIALARQVSEDAARLDRINSAPDSPPPSPGDAKRTIDTAAELESEAARGQLLMAVKEIEQSLTSPKDAMQNLYYRVCTWPKLSSISSPNPVQSAEAGVVQALCQLDIPRAVPLDGSISYQDLSAQTGLAVDRLQHLVRNAIICSNFLAETPSGEVAHNEISATWHVNKPMAAGFEVMSDNLPAASFKLGDSCSQDPADANSETCGFQVARDQPLYQYLETNPAERAKFAGHMRAQSSSHGDEAVRNAYDWNSLAGKTLVDVS